MPDVRRARRRVRRRPRASPSRNCGGRRQGGKVNGRGSRRVAQQDRGRRRETRGRLGTFVLPPDEGARDEGRAAAADYARRTAELGIPAERALDLVRAALADR